MLYKCLKKQNIDSKNFKLNKFLFSYNYLLGDEIKAVDLHEYNHDIVTCLDEYNAAVHRAMLLSPSGRGLNTWWRAHRSSTTCEFACEHEDEPNNFQSLLLILTF